ncbi:hypothetical protein SUGI_0479880 [Cryptomeria japonica]|uniref:uncharacterized protein LOC131051145 n=1 Tax=Cryptomeria japonica TaxID=3369 RepID=UPI002408DC3F|nr:uncharacterized protein LOC131051145 [Cryptomeria japonica]GLJ25089.1 hypothetical protein SUGI_0479880 [Cryptomeria japonica]
MRSSVKQLLNGGIQVFQIRKTRAHISICRSFCAQAQERGESEGGKRKWKVPVENADEGHEERSSSVLKDVKQHLVKEIETAKDMVKNIPEKTKETKEEIKDLGGVAKEAAKRDLHKVAQKVGLAKDD